jgi:hypothetical protein
MEYDHDKIDEMVLALLWLTPAGHRRAWKSHDWDALWRLHAKGVHLRPQVQGEVGSVQRGRRAPGAGNSSNVILDGRARAEADPLRAGRNSCANVPDFEFVLSAKSAFGLSEAARYPNICIADKPSATISVCEDHFAVRRAPCH